jgi:hypothetical protein
MNPLDTKEIGEAFAAYLPLPANLEPRLEEALRQILQNPGSLQDRRP